MLTSEQILKNGTKQFNKEAFFKRIDYTPHDFQWRFHNSEARFRILSCGRRWGKSISAAAEAMQALVKLPNQMGWIVAPTYELSRKIFREVFWKFHKNLPHWVEFSSERDQTIKLKNGSILIGKTSDNPVSLIGEGLDFLIIDEASRVKRDAWQEALRPTLADKQGWVVFVSTPKGKNWYYDLFRKGQNPDEVDYESWQFPTKTNPFIPEEEIEQAKQSLPRLIFQQEYEAEFLSEEDQFFSQELIESCISDIPIIEGPRPKKEYYLGVDFARMGQDSSVLILAERQYPDTQGVYIIGIYELKHKALTEIVGRIKALHKKFQFKRIYLDETGLGAGPTDFLKEDLKITINPITFTQKNKEDLYSNLKLLMERGKLKYPNHDKLIYQLTDLRYEFSSNGMLKLHHSDNGHDDFPDSLALAVWFTHGKVRYSPALA